MQPPFKYSALTLATREALEQRARERAQLVREVRRQFAAKANARRRFEERYGFARPPMATKMEDKWIIAIGAWIYKQTKEGDYNFVNALHDHALDFFGTTFVDQEEAKPVASRHPAMQWLFMAVERDERLKREGNTDPRARQTGAGAAWLRFAYDLYTIADNSELQAGLRRRLLSGQNWQGARHELRVAALCVVAGFDLAFEDDSDGSRTHPEFIATDKITGIQVAVEAKSRHRFGVQGFTGGKQVPPGERVNIRDIVLDGYKKQTPLPLYVFVDVNLPPCDDATSERWMEELETSMKDLSREGYADPCPANAVFFTNDPSHYVGDGGIGNRPDRLWIRPFTAEVPRVAHPTADLVQRFIKAHQQRLAPPADFVEF